MSDGYDGTAGIPMVSSIQPTGCGMITLEVIKEAGSNVYLDAFDISGIAAIPNPTTTRAMGFLGTALVAQRRQQKAA